MNNKLFISGFLTKLFLVTGLFFVIFAMPNKLLASNGLTIIEPSVIIPTTGYLNITVDKDYDRISLYNVVKKNPNISGFSFPSKNGGNYAIRAYIGSATKISNNQWKIYNVGKEFINGTDLTGENIYLAIARKNSTPGADYSNAVTVHISNNINDLNNKINKEGDRALSQISWSNVWSFTTIKSDSKESRKIDVPILRVPIDNTIIENTGSVYLSWKQVKNATKYSLQVSSSPSFLRSDSNFSEYNNIIGLYSQFWTPPVYKKLKLSAGTYYWRVRAENNNITGTFSKPWKFTINGSGEADHQDDTNPVNANCGSANNSTFESQPTSTFALCSLGRVGDVFYNTNTETWSWTCYGVDGGSNVSCNAIKNKVEEPEEAPVPYNCGQTQSSSKTDLSQHISWSNISSAYRYHIKLSDSINKLNNNNLIYENNIIHDTETTIPATYLSQNTTYYWKVKDWSASENVWSNICNFTTKQDIVELNISLSGQSSPINSYYTTTASFVATLNGSSNTSLTWKVEKNGTLLFTQSDDLTFDLDISNYEHGTYTITASNSEVSDSISIVINRPEFDISSLADINFNPDQGTLAISISANNITGNLSDWFINSNAVSLYSIDSEGNKIMPFGMIGNLSIPSDGSTILTKTWNGKNIFGEVYKSGDYNFIIEGAGPDGYILTSNAFTITIERNDPVLTFESDYNNLVINPNITTRVTARIVDQLAEGYVFNELNWTITRMSDNEVVRIISGRGTGIIATITEYLDDNYRITLYGTYTDKDNTEHTYNSPSVVNFTIQR